MKSILRLGFFLLVTQGCAQKAQDVNIAMADVQKIARVRQLKNPHVLKDMLGVNAFEWDFLGNPIDPNDATHIFEPKMELIKSFSGVRHYMDWEKLENEPGNYTFNPTHSGGWNYDAIYERCKKENILVLACLKNCPAWLQKTYPENERDGEDVPAPFRSNLEEPASYILQAKAAFQFAARYGSNKNVDTFLVKVNPKQRWTGDGINQVKIGLELVKYIECDNERDKTWKGKKAYQSPEQYAANLSAFYDGDKGRLGKNVGVKTADPTMQVVMAGLAAPEVKYVQGMIEWCKKHRGYKADGSVNLCFDVINYHFYANDAASHFNHQAKRGTAPELSGEGAKADEFVKLGKPYHLPVWVTEVGYDINKGSPQAAIEIGNKTTEDTQADWVLRTSLLFARHGIDKTFFYMLDDVNKESTIQYSSSGFVNGLSRRPSAQFILQTKNLMGNFSYVETLSQDPLVDVYVSAKKKMYVLTVPDETGRTAVCHLNLGKVKEATIYRFQPDTVFMGKKSVPVSNGKLTVTASERPIFIETN